MVGEKGLEPSPLTRPHPKCGASASSATRPIYCCFIYYRTNLSNENNSVNMYYLKKMIISPCISICKTDPVTGYCYGCGRSNEDKKIWKDEETPDEWKKNNLQEIQKRLNGWQLESFKESYDHKVNKGISLFEKTNRIKA